MNEFIMQMRPLFGDEKKKAICGDTVMEETSKLELGCILLPKITIGFGASVLANTIVSNNVKEGAIVGPRSRHFKTYGSRGLDKIRDLIKNIQENK